MRVYRQSFEDLTETKQTVKIRERLLEMAIFGCIKLTDEITNAANAGDQAGLLAEMDGDRGALALELVRRSLSSDDRALFDAEANSLPEPILAAVANLLVIASDNELSFDFVSAPPENVMEYARNRRVRMTFEIEDGGIKATIQHTLRHPSWLPEVELPTEALAAATS